MPAGDAAIGYTALTTQAFGHDDPVVRKITELLYDQNKGNLSDRGRIGTAHRASQQWLEQHRKDMPRLTSGGDQKIAAIGRGLMARARLVVLDEPSLGLAPLIVAEFLDALSRLNRETGPTHPAVVI